MCKPERQRFPLMSNGPKGLPEKMHGACIVYSEKVIHSVALGLYPIEKGWFCAAVVKAGYVLKRSPNPGIFPERRNGRWPQLLR